MCGTSLHALPSAEAHARQRSHYGEATGCGEPRGDGEREPLASGQAQGAITMRKAKPTQPATSILFADGSKHEVCKAHGQCVSCGTHECEETEFRGDAA